MEGEATRLGWTAGTTRVRTGFDGVPDRDRLTDRVTGRDGGDARLGRPGTRKKKRKKRNAVGEQGNTQRAGGGASERGTAESKKEKKKREKNTRGGRGERPKEAAYSGSPSSWMEPPNLE